MKNARDVPDRMRAVQLTGHGGLDRLKYVVDAPTPKPAEGEVLVQVAACGLNNTDINTRSGWYDRTVDTALTEEMAVRGRSDDAGNGWTKDDLDFPLIQGAAVAGYITAVGTGVDAARVGERVLVDPSIRDESAPTRAQLLQYLGSERDGGYAEYVAVPSLNAHRIASGLSDAELATFPCSYDTAEEMLVRADLAKGETLLVTGAAGGVGTALIQLAHVRGARVIAVAGRSKRVRLEELGADHFVARESDGLVAEVAKLVGSAGVDVVADVVGGALFDPIVKLLRRAGRYTTAGAIGGPVTSFDLRDLIYKDLEMYGITNPTAATFARLVRLIEEGRLRPVLEDTYDLSDLAKAQELLAKRSHVGKFVVTLW